MNTDDQEFVKRDIIIGSNRVSNYIFAITLLIGGCGFILAGLSSYLKINLLPFADPTQLSFLPQGITMLFYGSLALCLSLYNGLTILWDVGSGYNEYDKRDEIVRIVRNGFPGPNRRILLTYQFSNIKSIKINIQDGINPNRNIVLCTKDERQIPLLAVGQPESLSYLESKASELAKFLNVNLE
jgi:hypothetical protein